MGIRQACQCFLKNRNPLERKELDAFRMTRQKIQAEF
jgi:hypothetical protein